MKKLFFSLIIISFCLDGLWGQSATTDYYRSKQTGNWNDPNTWESSPNSNFIPLTTPATLVPTLLADSIIISSGTTVTIDNALAVTAQKLAILSGGTLSHPIGSVFSLNDGPGTDMIIYNGGTYVLNGDMPIGLSITTTIDIQSGALVRVDGNSGLGQSDQFAANNFNGIVTFETGCTFQWNTTSTPNWNGQYYFTAGNNTNFVFSQAPGSALGGNTPTTIYGNVITNVNLTLQAINPSGIKYITNGISGTGTVDASGMNADIVFNGTNSILGGGTLKISSSHNLRIGQVGTPNISDTCTLVASQVIQGKISFDYSNCYIVLNGYNLTVTGAISVYSLTDFIKTNGGGYLIVPNVTSTGSFPIGDSTFNYLTITTSSGNDFYARVENGINPPIFDPAYGVRRTWSIYSSAITPNVQLTFVFASTDEGAKLAASAQPPVLAILEYALGWSITPDVTLTATGSPSVYVLQGNPDLTINTTANQFVLGLNWGYMLPLDCIVSCNATRQNSSGIISWTGSDCAAVQIFEVQKLVNGSFRTIGTVQPITNQSDYSFTDANLSAGVNQYRIKAIGFNGDVKYSNTVVLIYNNKTVFISSVSPNPAHDNATVTVSSAGKDNVQFTIYTLSGEKLMQWQTGIVEGNNTVNMDISSLSAGLYLLQASSSSGNSVVRFEKQ